MRSRKNFLMKTKLICSLTVLLVLLFSSSAGFASCVGAPAGNFVIRQETVRLGSVLVSRPSEIDTHIAGFLSKHNIKTLDEYALWLAKNARYEADVQGDAWASPKETLNRLYGDCEDYAFLNAAVLRVMGYNPKVMVLGSSEEEDHAICAFEKDGNYLWFNNGELERTDAVTMRKFGKHIFKKYACSRILEIDPETKKSGLLFIKSA
ncbi:MAG: hypothetical protein ISS33_05590 [Candidatus Omnitrophica bacterium]|nr:hypothetical protein [Candidatus Omnitrophota bacterium]